MRKRKQRGEEGEGEPVSVMIISQLVKDDEKEKVRGEGSRLRVSAFNEL